MLLGKFGKKESIFYILKESIKNLPKMFIQKIKSNPLKKEKMGRNP